MPPVILTLTPSPCSPAPPCPQALEYGPDASSDDDDSDGGAQPRGPTYVEEQEALKKAFHGALPGGGDSEEEGDDAGLVLKSRSVPEAGKGGSDGGKDVDKVGRAAGGWPVCAW